ncbi:MAG: Druantia anti-phage system protein DruA, partial [Pseudonocardiaceae bacterium]
MGTPGRTGTMTGIPPGAPAGPVRYCGRQFSTADLDTITALAGALPTRRAIADAVCDALDWTRPDGRRKDMSARLALNRMHEHGLITLPAPRHGNGNGHHARHADPQLPPPAAPDPIDGPLAELGPLQLTPVTTRADSARYNTLIRAHHYLGYTPLAGAQRRYLIHTDTHGILAVIAFAAAAWKCA